MIYLNAKLIKQFGKRYVEGMTLFKEGDVGNAMYVIHRGKVRISKMIDGQQQTLVVLGEGQFFGEMAILNGENRSATATVAINSEILEIPAAGFDLLLQKSPDVAMSLIKTLSGRLADTNKMLNVLFYPDDYTRILLNLQLETERKISKGNHLVRISVDPAIWASRLNISTARVQKVIDESLRAQVIFKDEAGYKIEQPKHLKYFLRYIQERQKEAKKNAA